MPPTRRPRLAPGTANALRIGGYVLLAPVAAVLGGILGLRDYAETYCGSPTANCGLQGGYDALASAISAALLVCVAGALVELTLARRARAARQRIAEATRLAAIEQMAAPAR